jgi:NIPSNAP
MRYAMRAQAGRDVGVEDAKAADYGATVIGEQREPDLILLRKQAQRLLGIVADCRDTQTFFFEYRPRLFQLDQLGTAVLSPIGTAVKHEKQPVRAREVRDRPQNACLIRKREFGNVPTRLRTSCVAVIRRPQVLRVQFGRNMLPSRPQTTELPHDRGFLGKIFRELVCHRLSYTNRRLLIAMIVEMRTYKLKPGKRDEFLGIFHTRSMPAHAEIGMKILGPFLSIEDPDTFFFMRGFPDLASREPMKAKFYEGDLWKNELENVLMPMIEKYDAVLVDDPTSSIRF